MPPTSLGLALSGMPLGFGIGALMFGPLGDRAGRRPLIFVAIMGVAAATALTALATSLAELAVTRIATGTALGACLVNLNALAAEVTPPRLRARALTFMSCGIPAGAAAIGFLMPVLVGWSGWRGVFMMLTGTILVVALAMLLWLPESPSIGEARRRAGSRNPRRPFAVSIFAPLARPYRLRTIAFIGLYTCNAFSLYMLSAWLPTILSQAGFSLADAARLSGVMQIGGVGAALLISTFVDRAAAVPALAGAYGLVLLALVLFGMLTPSLAGWGALLIVVGGGIAGAHLSAMALGALLYPPELAASALGLGVAIARLGAIGGPLYGQFLIARGVDAPAFFLSLTLPVMLCLGAVGLMSRLKERSPAM
jgi:AAHS family 4-hydroxybenzoate transporter-like MFS transporter